jgi:hypothetical protein
MSAALACVLIAGCSKATKGPGFDVLSTVPAAGPVDAEAIYPYVGGEWVYLVTVGDGAGGQSVHSREATERYRAAWVDHQAGRRSEYWRPDDAGNLVMPAVVDHDDRAVTFFEPPLILAYRRLEPGRQYEQTFSMRVMDARRPERQRDLGTGTQTIEYADDQVLKTPLGRIATRRVMVRFTAELKMARAETTTSLYVVPGVGAAVIDRREAVRLLGVPIRDRNQTLLLMSSPVPLPQP